MTARSNPRHLRTTVLTAAAALLVAAAYQVEEPAPTSWDAPAATALAVLPPSPETEVRGDVDGSLTAAPARVTGTIAGRVTDATTGAAVTNASIVLEDTDIAGISRETGQYLIALVPAGTYRYRAERLGYATVTGEVTVESGATVFLDLALTSTGPGGAPAPAGTQGREQVGRITGRVQQMGAGAPLADVQVYLVGASVGAISRQTGQYLMASVAPGTYEIRAERIGLTPVTGRVSVSAGQTLEQNFALSPLSPTALGLDESVLAGPAGVAAWRELQTETRAMATAAAAGQLDPVPPAMVAARLRELVVRYEAEAARAGAASRSATPVRNVDDTGLDVRLRGGRLHLDAPSPVQQPAATSTAPGSGRIVGRVGDDSGVGVSDVQLFLVGASLGAITRQNGTYLIMNVPPGTYQLRAERIGLLPATLEVTVPDSGTVEVNARVEPPDGE